jgi:hypothetical protein
MFTRPVTPLDSMRLAVFTVSPQMSYWNFFTPTMPATTGPLWMPTRISKYGLPATSSRSARACFMKSCISKAARTTSVGDPCGIG